MSTTIRLSQIEGLNDSKTLEDLLKQLISEIQELKERISSLEAKVN